MASISFTDEASESFANFLQHIENYTVAVIAEDRAAYPLPFDAQVLGSASEELDDFFGVKLQPLSEEGDVVGDPISIVVRDLKVY